MQSKYKLENEEYNLKKTNDLLAGQQPSRRQSPFHFPPATKVLVSLHYPSTLDARLREGATKLRSWDGNEGNTISGKHDFAV